MNHIVLKVKSYNATKIFYCDDLKLKDRSQQNSFLSIEIGNLIINFVQDDNFEDSWVLGIAHIGLQFSKRAEVDTWHHLLRPHIKKVSVSEISGGPGQGPYRFYLKDPHGYYFEFETWEGSSD
jgi:catechol 2,3-dioxygenase-like lactoylglutathione lyase family enzyme